MTKPKLAVGMTVWVVYFRENVGRERTIIKLGRKWAYTIDGKERFDIKTWVIDDRYFSEKGMVYPNEQAFKDHKALSLEYELLQKAFLKSSYRGIPNDMTLEKIQQIKALLGMAE